MKSIHNIINGPSEIEISINLLDVDIGFTLKEHYKIARQSIKYV